ncbi:MAG TPA: PA14 domain-containing protein [Fibrobacteria bacterium]|nr:PA14 domain-containing protein [Fibrobacteria bacterium]
MRAALRGAPRTGARSAAALSAAMVALQLPSIAQTFYWNRNPALSNQQDFNKAFNWSSNANGTGSRPASVNDDDFTADVLGGPWTFLDLDNDGGTGAHSLTANADQLTLTGRGMDVYGPTNEFVAVRRNDFAGDFDVTVKVASLTNTDPYAKAGIMVANDFGNLSAGGFAYVAVTPGNGPGFHYDISGNIGEIDGGIDVGSGGYPVWLRLVKKGLNLTAYYKTALAGSWSQIGGSATPLGFSGAVPSQIGLFSSSNAPGTTATAVFDDFQGGGRIAGGSADFSFNGTGAYADAGAVVTADVNAGNLDFTGYTGTFDFGRGNGLAAAYFDHAGFQGNGVTRVDPDVNFNWGSASPDPGLTLVPSNYDWSARWEGMIEPQFTETYTFYVQASHTRKLWVDDQLLVDNAAAGEYSGTIALTAGVKVPIRMEFEKPNGSASLTLSWSSASVSKVPVPTSALFAGRIHASGDVTFSTGMTLVSGPGVLDLNGSGAQTLVPKPSSQLPSIDKTGSGTVTVSSYPLTAGKLDVFAGTWDWGGSASTHAVDALHASGGTMTFGTNTVQVNSDCDLSGLGTLNGGSGVLEFTHPSNQNFTPKAGANHPHVKQSGSGTTYLLGDLTAASLTVVNGTFDLSNLGLTLTVGGNVLLNGGNLYANGGSMIVSGDVTLTTGIFTCPGSASSFSLAGSFTEAGGATADFNGGILTLAGNAPSKILDVHSTLNNLVVNGGGGSWEVTNQNLTAGYGVTVTAGTLDLSVNARTLVTPYLTLNGGTVEAAGGNVDVNGDFTMSSGTLIAPGTGKTFSISGNCVKTGGTLTPGTGTITLDGSATGKVLNIASTLNKLAIAGSGVWTVTGNGFTAADLSLAYGTLRLGTSLTSTVSGTVTFASAPALDFDAGTLRFSGASLDLNGVGTLTPGTGKIEFTGTSAQTFTPKSGSASPGVKQNGSGGTLIGSYPLNTDYLAIAAGTLDLGSGSHSVANTVAVTGGGLNFNTATLSVAAASVDLHLLSALNPGTGTLEFTRATAQSFTPKASTVHPTLLQSGAGTTTVMGNLEMGTLSLTGSGAFDLGNGWMHRTTGFSASGGSLKFNASTLQFSGPALNLNTVTSIFPGTGTLEFTGTSPQSFTPQLNTVHPAIRQSGSGGTTIVTNPLLTNSLLITGGTLHMGSFDLSVPSFTATGGGLDFGSAVLSLNQATVNFSGLASITPGTGTLKFTGSTLQTFIPKASAAHPNITQYGTGGTTVYTYGLAAGALTLNQGTFNLGSSLSHSFASVSDGGGGPYGNLNFGSSQLHVSGNVALGNTPTLTPGTGTLDFNGTGSVQLFTPKGSSANHPLITHTGSAIVRQYANDLFCLGFSQSAGQWDFNGFNLTTTSGGNLNVTNGTSSSFANLGTRTLTVSGNASFSGLSNANKLGLDPGSGWTIAVTGALNATMASLANSTASPNPGTCADCANGGGNANWGFGISWDGGGGADHNWSTPANWGSDVVPTSGDAAIFNSPTAGDAILDVPAVIKSILFDPAYTGTFDFSSHVLDVSGNADFRSGGPILKGTGTLKLSGNSAQTLYPKPASALPDLHKTGTGTLTFAGAAFTAGAFAIDDGTVNLGPAVTHTLASISAPVNPVTLNFGSANLAVTGNVDLTGVTVITSGNLLIFTGSSAQTFVPDPAATGLGLVQNGPGGATTVASRNFTVSSLEIDNGTFNLGSGRAHTVTTSFTAAGGSLDFGSSTLSIAAATVNLNPLAGLAAGTGSLEFTGASPQTFTAKGGAVHPSFKQNGTGGTTLSQADFTLPSLSIVSGTFSLGASRTLTLAAFSATGGGLDFGTGSVLEFSGSTLDLTGLASLTAGTGYLKLTGASPQTLVPLSGAVHPNIIQAGAGGTTVVTNGLTGKILAPNAGVFHMGAGLTHTFTSIAPGGAPYGGLDFGSSQVHATAYVDFGTLASLTPGTGSFHFDAPAGQTQTLVPMPGNVVHPPIFHNAQGTFKLLTNDLSCLAFSQSAGALDLNGRNLSVTGGDFTLANGAPGSVLNAGGAVIAVSGDAALHGTSSGTLLVINPASTWTLSVAGTLTADFASLGHAYAADKRGACYNCVDGGGNVNWFFPDNIIPQNVTGLQATALDGHSVRLIWTASAAPDADSVVLRYRVDGTYPTGPADGTLWRNVPKTRVSDTVTGLAEKAVFHFAAFVRDSSGNYAVQSNGDKDTARTPDVTPPANVTAFLGNALGPTKAALAWTASASADADSTMIRYRSDGAYPSGPADGTLLRTLPAARTADTATGLQAGAAYSFAAFARDSSGNYSASPATVSVQCQQNHAPEKAASAIPDSVPQNRIVSWTVDLGDPDAGDSVITVSAAKPSWLALAESPDSARGGYAAHRMYTFSGKPQQADVGNASIALQVRDLSGSTFTYAKSFQVTDVNDVPVFTAGQDSLAAKEDSVTRFVPRYADPDPGDKHTLALLQAPAWAGILDSVLVLAPGSRDVGPAAVRLTVSDGKSLDTLDLLVKVANVNDAPVAFPGANWQAPARWKEDAVDTFSVVVVDMDAGDPVVLNAALPAWLTYQASVDAGKGYNRFFRFTARPGQADTGSYPLKLRFQDASGAYSELPLPAKVSSVNDTPFAAVKDVQSRAGAARIALDATDPDGSAATTRFHYRLIGSSGDTVRSGICASATLALHPLADGEYRLAVAAEDEGGLKQPGYTLATLSIGGATALILDSARWNMIGYPGRTLAASALGAGAALTTWDESSEDGAPLGRYAAGRSADSLARGKGYWVRAAKPVTVKAPLAQLLDRPFSLKLTHGKQGWNQVGNPFPYFVDLSAAGLQFWEWDAARRDLVNARGILKPWGAYWVQVAKDTLLTVKDEPYFPAASGPLAKAGSAEAPAFLRADDWTLQMALQAGPYQDRANFLGIRNVTQDRASGVPSGGLTPDAPKFGDYIALHFEKPGEGAPDGLAHGYASDFRARLGEDEEWWDFSVENSGSGLRQAQLSLPGLQALENAGLHAFLVRKGEATAVHASTAAVLDMEGAATHYALVVSPHADFPDRLQGNFSISQNFPNPVSTHTAFRFFLPQTWDAGGKREAKTYRLRLNVYDFSGRLAAQVADGGFRPGSHTLIWKPQAKGGGALTKGAYVYRLEIPGFVKSLKLLVK